MAVGKKLGIALYVLFGWMAFWVSLYLTFPIYKAKEYVADQVETILAGSRLLGEGRPKVAIEDMDLWRLSGIKLRNMRVEGYNLLGEKQSAFSIERGYARLGLLSLLRGHRSVSFDVRTFGADFDGNVTVDKQQNVKNVDVSISKLDLGSLPIAKLRELQAKGTLDLAVNLDVGNNIATDGKGRFKISLKKASIGPGELGLGATYMGAFQVPKIELGNLEGAIDFVKGQGKSQKFALSGGDLEANVDMDIGLQKQLGHSTVNGRGWFGLKPEFLAKNEKFKTLLEILPGVATAKDEKGHINFSLKGPIGAPSFALGNSPLSERGAMPTPQGGLHRPPVAPPLPSATAQPKALPHEILPHGGMRTIRGGDVRGERPIPHPVAP
jgi:type II secretion system protein N